MFADFKLATRTLMKTPGFTLVAVATLALGIGAVTAVYSLISQVLLRPLPYPEAERLVVPFSVNAGRGIEISHVGLADYHDWRQEKVFERLAVFEDYGRTLPLSDEAGEAEQVQTLGVSRDYFAVLGVPKALFGRLFNPEDHRLAYNAVRPCLLSYGLWKRRYRGDPGIVGQRVQLDGGPCFVAGVMPQDVLWPENADIVQPMNEGDIDALETVPAEAYKSDFLLPTAIARLRPGRSLEQTNAVLAAHAKRTELKYPQQRQGWSNRAVSLQEATVGRQARTSLLVAMAAVCCLLAIAVINVAGLLLARAIARRQELQVRAALGASRWRLARGLLAESTALALPAGALGLLLATGGLHLLNTLSLPWIASGSSVRVDSGMWLCALLVSVLTAVVCGLTPLTHALRRELGVKRNWDGAGGARLLNGLIVAEITLSVLLLAGAGLLIRSFMAIQRNDPGFESERLLTFAATLSVTAQPGSNQVPEYNRERNISIFRDLIERLGEAPGVVRTAVSSALPLGGGGHYFTAFFRAEGQPQPSAVAEHPAMVNVVSEGFFSTLGIRRIAGRDFDSRDTLTGNQVVIVNEALARSLFPNENALGKRIRCGWDQSYREIVGVVGNVRYLGREDELRALAYAPHAQWGYSSMMLTVRTAGEPSAALAQIRRDIRNVHPELVLTEAKTMTDILDRSVAPRRSGMTIFALLAGAAMLLAAIGLYGALSYTVAQRVKEIGIRMALGARPEKVLGMIVGRGLRLTLMGVAFGLAGAFLLTRLMTHLLYQVSATDPITFISIAVLLTGVALMACYLPARRATKVDPLVALRAE